MYEVNSIIPPIGHQCYTGTCHTS